MTRPSLHRVTDHLPALDWSLARGSVVFTLGQALAGGLGFAFSMLVARSFSPGDFGAIQYAIALASLVAVVTQPFGQHVLARFVGRHRNDPAQLAQALSSAWIILLALCGLSALAAGIVLTALGTRHVAGVLAVFLGISVFYVYWGLARGFLASGRLTLAYVGGNLLQLVLCWFALYVLRARSPLVVLLIYGFCFLFPPWLAQRLRPLPVRPARGAITGAFVGELLTFAVPVWISHGSYVLFHTLDLLFLERFWGVAAVGNYAVARTLANAALYLPTGVATFLMPRLAETSAARHRSLFREGLLLALTACLVTLAGYLVFGRWLIAVLFGPQYAADLAVMVVLSLGMLALAANQVVTALLVGRGRPGLDSLSRVAAAAAAAAVGWLLVPAAGPLGAAAVVLAGPLAALVATRVLVMLAARHGRWEPPAQPAGPLSIGAAHDQPLAVRDRAAG
jgi:O-antigen/teichoic acid export membrane protein